MNNPHVSPSPALIRLSALFKPRSAASNGSSSCRNYPLPEDAGEIFAENRKTTTTGGKQTGGAMLAMPTLLTIDTSVSLDTREQKKIKVMIRNWR